jgi:hypothetical protein
MDIVEKYYQENNVYKALVICEDESSARLFIKELQSKDHTVNTIMDTDLDDDRPNYLELLYNFSEGMSRMIVVTSVVWYQIRHLLQVYVMTYQNLVMIHDMNDSSYRDVIIWLDECKQAGFVDSLNILNV